MKFIRRKDIRDFLNINGQNNVTDINSNNISNVNKYDGIQDPTFLTFTMWFDCESDMLTPGTSSFANLLLPKTDVNSAINYLIRINRRREAGYLEEFREQLLYIQKNKPWYFQSITGLNELMMLPSQDNPVRREKDKKLSIETLESFDMQMHFLADLYNKSVYDMTNKKYLLPRNMQQFNCKVIVTEIRDLFEVSKSLETETTDNIGKFDGESEKSYKKYLTDLRSDKNSWLTKIEGERTDFSSMVYEENSNQNTPTSSSYTDLEKAKNKVTSREVVKTKLQTLQEKLTYKIFELYYCRFDFNRFPSFENLSVNAVPEQAKMGFDILPGLNFTTTQYGFLEWVVSEYNKNYKTSNSKYINGNEFDTYNYVGWHNYTHGDIESISKRNANLDELEDEIQYQLDAESSNTDSGQVTIDQMTKSSVTSKSNESKLYGNLLKQSKSIAAKYLSEVERKYNDEKMALFNKVENTLDDVDITNPQSIFQAIENLKEIITFVDNYKEPNIDELKRQIPSVKSDNQIQQNVLDAIRQNRLNNSFDDIGKMKTFVERDDTDNEFAERERSKIYKLDSLELKSPEPNESIDELKRDVPEVNENIDSIEHFKSEIKESPDSFEVSTNSIKEDVDSFELKSPKVNEKLEKFDRTSPKVNETVDSFGRVSSKGKETVDSIELIEPKVNASIDSFELIEPKVKENTDSFSRVKPEVNDNSDDIELKEPEVNKNLDGLELSDANVNTNIDSVDLVSPNINTNVDNFERNISQPQTNIDNVERIEPQINENLDTLSRNIPQILNTFDSITLDTTEINDSIDNIDFVDNTQINSNIDSISRTSIYENKVLETLNRTTVVPNNNIDELHRVSNQGSKNIN